MKTQKSKVVLAVLSSLLASSCLHYDDIAIPAQSNALSLQISMAQGPSSSVDGFGAAQYIRDTYGIVFDAVTVLYPNVQINLDFADETLHMSGDRSGLRSFNGIYNGITTASALVESDSANKSAAKKSKRKAKQVMAPYHAAAAGAIDAYTEILNEVFTDYSLLSIPGKDSAGLTRILRCAPGTVNFTCVKKDQYQVGTTHNLVGNTACVGEIQFYLSQCTVE